MSTVSLTMAPDGNLMIYHSNGRPNKETSEILKCDKAMKKELEILKTSLSFKEGTEILLALSIVSDEMSRCVHMFPEVMYMDVTANTNRQKRDLFLMVVKDANGETFVGNATVIPSGKHWVFLRIYETFFIHLFGEETISRNRLALTDDDHAEHGPFDNLIKTMSCYSESTHMLCVFHAIVMSYHEKIYPKLPRKRVNTEKSDKQKSTNKKRKELSAVGELYGKYF